MSEYVLIALISTFQYVNAISHFHFNPPNDSHNRGKLNSDFNVTVQFSTNQTALSS